jgi:hypothetical protein
MSGSSSALGVCAWLATVMWCACSRPDPHSRSADATRSSPDRADATATDVPERARYCAVELPDLWRAALAAGVQRHGTGEQRQIELVASDGSLFGETFVPGRRHALYWSPPDSRTGIVLQRFEVDDGSPQVLGASFDGRYLAYTLLRSMTTFDSWILYVWDTMERRGPREIARSPREWNQALAGPLNTPLVHDGRVIWVQAVGGPDGETAIYSLDVARDVRRTIRQGHPLTPIAIGDTLIWPESPRPGALTELRGVDLAS